MVNDLNFLLISGHISNLLPIEIAESWLLNERNSQRLLAQCEKIWSNCESNPQYDAERAFRLLSRRFAEVCFQEQQH